MKTQINMQHSCSLCREINSETIPFGYEQYNLLIKNKLNIIAQNNSFTLIPSIGPLNNGHILIVPNRHILSFAELKSEELQDLLDIKNKIINYNNLFYGLPVEFFEHGTGISNNYCGSCISHAHLHCVPSRVSLTNYINDIGLKMVDTNIQNEITENGYLYFEDILGNVFFDNTGNYESQLFRKYYAKYIFKEIEWNWRTNPNLLGVIEVISYYQDMKNL